jgi:hypothetical protein
VIAAGAGHEIGKHRLLSDGVCAPWGGGKTPQGKGCLAAGQKKSEERREERGKQRLRDQKSKQKYLKKQNKQQCTMQGTKTVLFSAPLYPWGGVRGRKARNGGRRPKNLET